MDEPAIIAEGLSKRYAPRARTLRFQLPWSRLREDAGGDEDGDTLDEDEDDVEPEPDASPDGTWALRDVSFEVEPGTIVAVIGGTAAGKSTLVRVLARVTPPTAGTVRLRGRVAPAADMTTALLRPDWNARRNVASIAHFLNVPKALALARVDEILEFAHLERNADKPLRHYSSGMRLRLAFSTVAHLEPDILLGEGAVGPGDEVFRAECLELVRELVRERGLSVIFATVAAGYAMTVADRAIWLEHGRIREDGPAETVARRFHETVAPA